MAHKIERNMQNVWIYAQYLWIWYAASCVVVEMLNSRWNSSNSAVLTLRWKYFHISAAVCLWCGLLSLHYAWGLTTLHQLSPSWPLNPIWTLGDIAVVHQGGCKMSPLTRKLPLTTALPLPSVNCPPRSGARQLAFLGSKVWPPLWSNSLKEVSFVPGIRHVRLNRELGWNDILDIEYFIDA